MEKYECVCGRMYWPRQAWAHEKCVARVEPSVANSVDNKATAWITPLANAKKPSYRYRDPEARRKYMRELMRKRRAA